MPETMVDPKTENAEQPAPGATTETPAIGKAAFAAARAQLDAQSKADQGAKETDTKDDDTGTTPAEEPEKTADQPTETVEEPEDTLLTSDEVAKLSPKERTLYEKAQKVFTQKSQALAEQRRAFEEWNPLIEAMKRDPKDAIARAARELGLTIQVQDNQDTIAAKASTEVDQLLAETPELGHLKPVLERLTASLMTKMQSELAPVREATTRIVSEAAAAETQATVDKFSKDYPDWKQFEPKMLELAQKFVPTAGAMSDYDYMKTLYRIATEGRTEAAKTRKVVEKINKSAEASESKTAGVPDERVEMVMPESVRSMDSQSRFREAYKAARRGETWA